MKVQKFYMKVEEKKVDTRALCAWFFSEETKRAKVQQDKDVIKRTNDHLMGGFGCFKEKRVVGQLKILVDSYRIIT